jgi:cell division protein FtsN
VSGRYFEVVLSGRQFGLLIAAVVGLVGVAFVLGIGVGVQQPSPPEVHMAALPPTPVPSSVVEEPTAAPVEPTPQPTVAPAPTPPREPERPLPRLGHVQPGGGGRWVQVAALSRREQADGVRQRVIALGFTAAQVVIQATGEGKYRVRLGPFLDEESARRVTSRLHAEGFAGAFLVR